MRVFLFGAWATLSLLASQPARSESPVQDVETPTNESQEDGGNVGQQQTPTNDSERVEGKDGAWAEFRTLQVTVVDEEENPVVGAALSPYAMRMKEEDGHGFWNYELLGPPQSHVTNDAGQTNLRFPRRMFSYHKMLTTRLISYSVQHPLFVSQTIHLDLGKDLELTKTDVTMVEGAELRVSATGRDGTPLQEFGVLMAGRSAPNIWSEEEKGNKLTRSIQDGTWQTMIVKASDDDRHLFSDCIALKYRKGKSLNLRKMPLTPGAVFKGTLSENVPRPVKNGYAILVSVPIPANSSWDESEPSLEWHDWAEVEQDGTFRFESIPRGGVAQVIVSCEGWLSKTTIDEARSFVMGQLFEIEEDQVDARVEMEASGTVELTVLAPDGKPLDEGSISSWPNQSYYKGGATILGTRYRTAKMLKIQSIPLSERPSMMEMFQETVIREGFDFLDQKVQQGSCTLRGFPVGKRERMVLSHPEYKLIGNDAGGGDEYAFQVDSPAPKQLVLKTVSRQTPDWMVKAQDWIEKAAESVRE